MYEEKEQTQFVVGGSDSYFWNFRSFFVFWERKQHREDYTLTGKHSGDFPRLPLGQI